MTTVTTWQQDQFITPNRGLYRWPGDFWSIDEFLPSLDRQRLERAPSWEQHYDYPSDFEDVQGCVWSHSLDAITAVGQDTNPNPDEIGSFYVQPYDGTISSKYTLGVSGQVLDGLHKQNALYAFNKFWLIADDGRVYRANNPWTAAGLSAVYTPDDANDHADALLSGRDTLWLLDDEPTIHKWNNATSQFEVHHTFEYDLYFPAWFYFRDSLLLLGRHWDGELTLLEVDDHDPPRVDELVTFPHATGRYSPQGTFVADFGTPWTIHKDDLYFSPGAYESISDYFAKLPIYRFNGSKVDHIDTVDVPLTPDFSGLLSWRDRLLLYFGDSGDQRVYVLLNGRFTQFLSSSYTTPDLADIYNCGEFLAMPTTDGGTDGLTIVARPATTNVFVSSWLDMGHPASDKVLSRLAAVVSDDIASFAVKIEYRTETVGWTEAVETSNARHIYKENIGTTFKLLQIRITFTDSTGNYEDIKLESLAATYSYGVR
jgi:hypothetical protein